MLVVVLALVALLVLATAVTALRSRRRGEVNATFLQWDPHARAAWRAEVDATDLELMLALHNDTRDRQGLAPVTIDEYREKRRDS